MVELDSEQAANCRYNLRLLVTENDMPGEGDLRDRLNMAMLKMGHGSAAELKKRLLFINSDIMMALAMPSKKAKR